MEQRQGGGAAVRAPRLPSPVPGALLQYAAGSKQLAHALIAPGCMLGGAYCRSGVSRWVVRAAERVCGAEPACSAWRAAAIRGKEHPARQAVHGRAGRPAGAHLDAGGLDSSHVVLAGIAAVAVVAVQHLVLKGSLQRGSDVGVTHIRLQRDVPGALKGRGGGRAGTAGHLGDGWVGGRAGRRVLRLDPGSQEYRDAQSTKRRGRQGRQGKAGPGRRQVLCGACCGSCPAAATLFSCCCNHT